MIRRFLPALVASALALAGCGAFSDGPAPADDAAPGADDAGRLLASFYPLQYLAQQVGGERMQVTSLTPPTVDPHTIELAPRTVAELDRAALVVYLSGFQPAVDEAVDVTGASAFDSREHADLLTTGQTGHQHADDEHAHDGHDGHDGHDDDDHDGHDDETGERDGHGTEEHDHAGEPFDPHFWLDPVRLAGVGLALADELATLDPDGADTYRANAEELAAELTALDEEMTAGLASCERDTIVVAHEAYGYLTAPRGIQQAGLSGIDPEAEPSPARLAQVAAVVGEYDVDTIFVETLLNPAVSQAFAEDLGLRTAVLDPLENQQDESADYLDVMRANLTALQEALGCSTD